MIKKIIIIFFLLLISFISLDNIRLQKTIDECPYKTSEYKLNKFDCSNMTAMLGDWLKYYNYNVRYCMGEQGTLGHIWLVIDDDIYVESTIKYIVNKETYKQFHNISCADDYRKLPASSDEWDYPKDRFEKENNND
jgi:hypothetical protein